MLHSMWDLSHQSGIEPVSPALAAQSLNHWTTREVLCLYLLCAQQELSAVLIFFSFNLTTLQGKDYYYLHFTDGKTETQRGYKNPSWDRNPDSLTPEPNPDSMPLP